MVTHRSNPQKDHLCADKRRLSHKSRKSVQRFDLGARRRIDKKARTGQDRTAKRKATMAISPICGESHNVPIKTKISVAANLADIIKYAKFQDDIFGVTILQRGGVEFSIFLLTFA